MINKLHIVSFDVPYPPNYGGAIDVFFKLKALSALGIEITLHTFEYGRYEQEELEKYCVEVCYYQRNGFVKSMISILPFIVKTRTNKLLEQRLLAANCPILFEGLHTTSVLKNKEFKKIKTLVRAHNIEHNYYNGLATSEKSFWKKAFFKWEATKLKKYEKILKNATCILTISLEEQQYFLKLYGEKSVYIPVFTDVEFSELEPEENKILWHGDLRVSDNIQSALFAIEVVKNTPYKLIIASNRKNNLVLKAALQNKNVELNNLSNKEDLDVLFARVKVNMLFTYQSTGIKLKLLNALVKSRFVLVNSLMVNNTGLESACVVANSENKVKQELFNLMKIPFTEEERMQRKKLLESYKPNKNAQRIIDILGQKY